MDDGGRVAMFGADSLRRPVRVGGRHRERPGRPPAPPIPSASARSSRARARRPCACSGPGLGLFRGTDELLGSFTLFERSVALAPPRAKAPRPPPGATPSRRWWATAWGRGPWSAWARRDGRPCCARSAPAWRSQRVTRNLWRLLSSAPVKKEVADHRRRLGAGGRDRRRGLRVLQGRPRHREARLGRPRSSTPARSPRCRASARPPSPGPPTRSTTNGRTWPRGSITARRTSKVWRLDGKDTLEFRPPWATDACTSPSRRDCSSPSTAGPARSKWKRNFKRCAASSPARRPQDGLPGLHGLRGLPPRAHRARAGS